MGSVRFPGKVLQPVCGTPLIGLLLERLGRSRHIDQIVLATSEDARNEPLASYVTGLGVTVFRGSEKNVLDRYYRAARSVAADVVIRITGDCPLIDPQLVDTVIEKFRASGADYVSNTSPPTYPDGLDTEVFRFSALETAWKQASTDFQKEHVTPFLRESPQFTKLTITHDTDVSTERWTVDEPADLDPVRRVFEHFHPRRDFDWLEVLAVRNSHPEWFMSNRHLTRNEGQELGTGQKLWKRAKQVIPGGSMLLSKRAEMFLPEKWPAYFSKAKGCRVIYFAGYKRVIDRYKVEEIERAADTIVWCCDEAPGFTPDRPGDLAFVGNIVEALDAYGTGALGAARIPLAEVSRIIAIGSDGMMNAVGQARHGILARHLDPAHRAIASINSPMQCMMKEICAQCLQTHKDPVTGVESVVFSCFNQDQDLDKVHFKGLRERLSQNGVQEKLTRQWIDRSLRTLGLRTPEAAK